jgi:hypothetical protein
MIARSTTWGLYILAVTRMLPSAFGAAPGSEQIALQKEGIELIGQVVEAARDIRYDADRLNSFTRSTQISTWSHSHHLTYIKSSVNDGLQPAFQRLTEIRPKLPAWKQKRIDDMLASAKALAAEVEAAISIKNAGTTPPVLNPQYKDSISRIYDHADTLIRTAEEARIYATEKLKAAQNN